MHGGHRVFQPLLVTRYGSLFQEDKKLDITTINLNSLPSIAPLLALQVHITLAPWF